jgi:hypothetical protein
MFAWVKQCESYSMYEDFEPRKDTDLCDSSNNDEVAEIYAMLKEYNGCAPIDIQGTILVVSANFNREAIVRAILADHVANGVESIGKLEFALDIACTNGHLEIAKMVACGDDGQVKSLLPPSSALRYTIVLQVTWDALGRYLQMTPTM